MMKYFLISILLLMTSGTAIAGSEQSAYVMYKMNNLITKKTLVDIMVVDDVSAVCRQESAKRLGAHFEGDSKACAFWNEKTCTIIVGQKTNNDLLGHEIRHCFQGDFH